MVARTDGFLLENEGFPIMLDKTTTKALTVAELEAAWITYSQLISTFRHPNIKAIFVTVARQMQLCVVR
jgi:hypothetical protein